MVDEKIIMKNVSAELHEIVQAFAAKFDLISDAEFSAKPSANKWSKKEIIGHLIDSAHNNLRRFVTGQYEEAPPRIRYEQEFWVDANRYQEMNREDLILLWKLMNERIAVVLTSMDGDQYHKQCDSGKTDPQLHSIQFLAQDYVVHLKHHLRQIFPE